MTYKIDPVADWPLVEEFRKTPIGRHSPNLLRILNLMRHDPTGYQVILVNRVPLREWVLGVMPPDRSAPIVVNPETVFYSREDAEWAVFCARWFNHTGRAITTPRSTPL